MDCRTLAWSVAVLLGVLASNALADWQVWAVAETVRALRDAPAGTNRAVALSAARNEWESFQILMRSDAAVRGVTIEPSDLKGPSGAVLRAKDVRLYRQHQLELTIATHRNDAFKPGWYPDPLIPFDHPVTRQLLPEARFRAVPFDLPADETHGFWIDRYAPPDTPAGSYTGTYRVRAEGRPAVEIPVSLTIWDFALPAVPTMQTALGSPASRMRGYYAARAKAGKEPEPSDWAAVDAQCAQMLSRHRINATPPAEWLKPEPQADGSYRIAPESIDALRKFVDTYHVNAVQTPHPSSAVKDPEAERAKLHAWLKAFDVAAEQLARPQVTLFTYLRDEPNDKQAYAYVQKWGRAVRAAKSALKVMVVEQTKTQDAAWGDLYGAVDIWCPLFSLHDPETAAQRQAIGEVLWTYTALCQRDPTPWWHIDFPLLNYRAPAWQSWRYRIRGLLYWGGMVYWRGVEDPWTDPKTLDRRQDGKGPLYNGEGAIVYPGRAVGYDGIADSLRLKALRDGIEDYEYLALLERAGLAQEAEKIVLPLAGSFFQWDKAPAAYNTARAQLATLITAAKRP